MSLENGHKIWQFFDSYNDIESECIESQQFSGFDIFI